MKRYTLISLGSLRDREKNGLFKHDPMHGTQLSINLCNKELLSEQESIIKKLGQIFHETN